MTIITIPNEQQPPPPKKTGAFSQGTIWLLGNLPPFVGDYWWRLKNLFGIGAGDVGKVMSQTAAFVGPVYIVTAVTGGFVYTVWTETEENGELCQTWGRSWKRFIEKKDYLTLLELILPSYLSVMLWSGGYELFKYLIPNFFLANAFGAMIGSPLGVLTGGVLNFAIKGTVRCCQGKPLTYPEIKESTYNNVKFTVCAGPSAFAWGTVGDILDATKLAESSSNAIGYPAGQIIDPALVALASAAGYMGMGIAWTMLRRGCKYCCSCCFKKETSSSVDENTSLVSPTVVIEDNSSNQVVQQEETSSCWSMSHLLGLWGAFGGQGNTIVDNSTQQNNTRQQHPQ